MYAVGKTARSFWEDWSLEDKADCILALENLENGDCVFNLNSGGSTQYFPNCYLHLTKPAIN